VPHEARPAPKFLPPAEDPELPGYGTVESETVSGYSEVEGVQRDEETDTATVILENRSATRYPWGVHEVDERITHQANDRNPDRTSVVGDYAITVRLPERTLRFQGVLEFRSDRDGFRLVYTRRLSQDGGLVRQRTWSEGLARDFQ
jgi:hypothetical protein